MRRPPALLGGTPLRPQGPPGWPLDDPAVVEAVEAALADGTWGRYHGPHSGRLGERLAEYHGCEHVVLCASGTAAVELALRGVKVGPGDEVILAAYDFKANFQNVLTLGATPVLVDVRPGDWQLDPDRLEQAIGPATRAVIVSHLHGGAADLPRVREIAGRHGLAVIEDACQAHGAAVSGRRAGTWGDVGVLSFGGSKLLTAGRGGAILTSDAGIVQRIRLYTQRGNEAYPLSELQAAVLVPQLERLDERNAVRARRVALLRELLASRPGLVPFASGAAEGQPTHDHPPLRVCERKGTGTLADPDARGIEPMGREPVPFLSQTLSTHHCSLPAYYKLGLQYDPAAFDGLPRDTFAAALRAEGIALDPGFRALHLTHNPRRFRAPGDLPHADDADRRGLMLHHPVLLGSEDDIRQIAAAVDKVRACATMLKTDAPTAAAHERDP